jgi:hypothetical protein
MTRSITESFARRALVGQVDQVIAGAATEGVSVMGGADDRRAWHEPIDQSRA